MMIYRLTILLCALLIVAGCAANQPVPIDAAKPVPQSSILNTAYMQYDVNKSKIIVIRDFGHRGSLCTVRLYVDGNKTADFESSEKIELYLDVGEHVLGVKVPDDSLCIAPLVEITTILDKQKIRKYRITAISMAGFGIMRTAF